MRNRARKFNKMLLDSLVSKSVAAPRLNQGVKNSLTRVLATALAMLMLFSIVI